MASASNISLPALFAEFYDEVARIKLAIAEGRLPLYLGDGKASVSVSGTDMAAMVSQRLKHRLQQQSRYVKDNATEAEIEAYAIAQYAMAGLVDEIFILEVDWSGADAWSDYLLEQGLFATSTAGRNFFTQLDDLLRTRARGPLQDDLAAVFLFALRLGFKGQYRGQHAEAMLQTYRAKLVQFLGAGYASGVQPRGFAQAYQYTMSEARDERLAPLSRWYRFAALGLAIYLVISSVVWFTAINRFSEALLGG